MTQMKPLATLKSFFGFRPGTGIKEFSEEVKQLSPDEKMELARLAAEAMGTELDES